MTRSAPLDAQEALAAAEAAQARTPVPRCGSRAAGVVAAVIALALIGYAVLWAVVALQLRGGVLDWIEARQAEGYRVTHSGLSIGGFPGAARVTIAAPVIAAPDGRALGWSWAGERAVLEARPLHRESATLGLSGEQSIAVNVGGKLRTYHGGAEELTLHAYGGATPKRASLSVRNLAMAAEELGDVIEVARLEATGGLVERPPAAQPAAAYEVTIQATDLRLPQQLQLPLGETIAELSTDAVVAGPLPAGTALPDALARWRAAGGSVELSRLRLRYGPMLAEGPATASLDADMQPAGTFMARIQGFQQTVAALAKRGLIDEQTAARARVALAILGRPGADGAPPALDVPLNLRNRTLSIGPLPLLIVPPIEWPRGPNPHSGSLQPLALAVQGQAGGGGPVGADGYGFAWMEPSAGVLAP